MKFLYKYYLHDNSTRGEFRESIESRTDVQLTDEDIENMQGLFYEIELLCEYDTDTGEAKVISAR